MITLDKIARYEVFGDEREEFCKYFLKVLKSKDDNDKENLIRKISKESTIESYEIIIHVISIKLMHLSTI